MSPAVISQVGTKVRISWVAPNSNGESISAYYVYILQKPSNLYIIDSTICDGSTNPVFTDRYCEFEMSNLLYYTPGEKIDAKVQAFNSKGFSILSDASSDVSPVLYQSVPTQPVTGLTGVST